MMTLERKEEMREINNRNKLREGILCTSTNVSLKYKTYGMFDVRSTNLYNAVHT